jgi:hypothetical protein
MLETLAALAVAVVCLVLLTLVALVWVGWAAAKRRESAAARLEARHAARVAAIDARYETPMLCTGCGHRHRSANMTWTLGNAELRCVVCCRRPDQPARPRLLPVQVQEATS